MPESMRRHVTATWTSNFDGIHAGNHMRHISGSGRGRGELALPSYLLRRATATTARTPREPEALAVTLCALTSLYKIRCTIMSIL